jgi:hypothetical protein
MLAGILWILAIGAALGAVVALANRRSPAGGVKSGALLAAGCLLQILIPAAVLVFVLWVVTLIVG